jgi:hypothetical protein
MITEVIKGTEYEVLKTQTLPNGLISYAIKGLKRNKLYFTVKYPDGSFKKVYGGI